MQLVFKTLEEERDPKNAILSFFVYLKRAFEIVNRCNFITEIVFRNGENGLSLVSNLHKRRRLKIWDQGLFGSYTMQCIRSFSLSVSLTYYMKLNSTLHLSLGYFLEMVYF